MPDNKLTSKRPRAHIRPLQIITEEQLGGGMLPLDYMLAVIRDPNATQDRRDRMAVAAAPYCHPKLMERHTVGKKDQQAAAEPAGMGTPWAKDLDFDDRRPPVAQLLPLPEIPAAEENAPAGFLEAPGAS